jgi:hypothetical protein
VLHSIVDFVNLFWKLFDLLETWNGDVAKIEFAAGDFACGIAGIPAIKCDISCRAYEGIVRDVSSDVRVAKRSRNLNSPVCLHRPLDTATLTVHHADERESFSKR